MHPQQQALHSPFLGQNDWIDALIFYCVVFQNMNRETRSIFTFLEQFAIDLVLTYK